MQIEIEHLGKTYDGHDWAVHDLSLEIPSGSIFGLIGPNGAGKSTALRMVATVMDPSTGRIAYDGHSAGEGQALRTTELRRRIGFLGDGNPLYKHMTPAEYLRFFGQCFELPPAKLEAAIEQVLVTFDLTGKADAQAGALSKGMRQRLLIARCLLHEPSLLILDEPADGLDPRGRSDLRRILGRVRDQGVTVIISSHILRELDDLCDQVAIMQRGRLVVGGQVGDIIDRYEVGRFVYELRLLDGSGLAAAQEVLSRHRVLIERESVADGLPCLSIQVQGGEAMMAEVLSDLVAAGVKVVTVSRLRSRLEDVYDRLSEDRVN
ncbi:ABC transporter ATP-binding protein [Paraliomyxa miuraensis]|uniref:ABC transporter ATP-binding protein n=1 Tax=Paraliomyxa miuraensis TaxID=376150 RepID=UPI0022558F50|nr:ABC transporter ATP-binding protein [Paraliomyxa miuraensis]MCX4240000.1 ABC transporter ATP-binding protein [Paraliomyxa miuraensis]